MCGGVSPGKLILSFGMWFDSKAVGDFRLGQERVNHWLLKLLGPFLSFHLKGTSRACGVPCLMCVCVLTNRLWDSYMCSQYSM